MFISKTNIINGTSPTVSTGVGLDLPSNVTNSDFSLNYTASSQTVIFRFGAMSDVSYVAVSAFNASQVTIFNEGSEFLNVNLTRNNVVMFVFDARAFTDLRVRVIGSGASSPTINHVAAGVALKMPNGGEQAGYSRNYLTRNVKSRTVTSNLAAPITSLQQRMPLKGTLSLPDVSTAFAVGEWQELLDFLSTGQVFYITEQESTDSNNAESSYACYSPMFSAPKAHAKTRALQKLTLGFNCYNGL
jgi:hypothetical protein